MFFFLYIFGEEQKFSTQRQYLSTSQLMMKKIKQHEKQFVRHIESEENGKKIHGEKEEWIRLERDGKKEKLIFMKTSNRQEWQFYL